MLKRKSLGILGLAEIFLQQEGEIEIPGYVWYGHTSVQEVK